MKQIALFQIQSQLTVIDVHLNCRAIKRQTIEGTAVCYFADVLQPNVIERDL